MMVFLRHPKGEALESSASQDRDKAAALKFMKRLMRRHGGAKTITIPTGDRVTLNAARAGHRASEEQPRRLPFHP